MSEWNYMLATFEGLGDESTRRRELIDGIPFIKSKIIVDVRSN